MANNNTFYGLESSLLGKEIQDVADYFTSAKIPYRISAENGVPFILTCDFNPIRANLTVENGIVRKISFG